MPHTEKESTPSPKPTKQDEPHAKPATEQEPKPSSLPIKSRTNCDRCHKQFKSRNKLMKHVYSKTCTSTLESTGKLSTISSTSQLEEMKMLRADIAMIRDEQEKLRNELRNELKKVRREIRDAVKEVVGTDSD